VKGPPPRGGGKGGKILKKVEKGTDATGKKKKTNKRVVRPAITMRKAAGTFLGLPKKTEKKKKWWKQGPNGVCGVIWGGVGGGGRGGWGGEEVRYQKS